LNNNGEGLVATLVKLLANNAPWKSWVTLAIIFDSNINNEVKMVQPLVKVVLLGRHA